MNTSDKFKEITSYQSNSFQEWFRDMEFEDKSSKLYSKELERNMRSKEILNELKPTELTLGEVFNYLKDSVDKSTSMIFYVRDSSGVLCAVGVEWDDVGWFVVAYSTSHPFVWLAGYRVFSASPFENLESSPLDTLTLEKAIELVKKEGYKVIKEL